MSTKGAAWRVRLPRAAEADLERIVYWTAGRFGENQARACETILKKALDALHGGPAIAGAKRRPEIAKGLHSVHVARHSQRARHFFFFRVVETDCIEVVRILHDGMDFQQHLAAGEPGET